jgi:hypothetical protein
MSSNFDNLSMAHPPQYHEDGRTFGSSDTSVNPAALSRVIKGVIINGVIAVVIVS